VNMDDQVFHHDFLLALKSGVPAEMKILPRP
jgi:hypothetical protein